MANGVKLVAKNGQTLNITAARGSNTKFFRLSKASLAPVDVIFKALREVFPRDNFRLYREVYKGIKKNSYGVEFAEPPRTTAKHVTFPETDNAGKGMWTAPLVVKGSPYSFCMLQAHDEGYAACRSLIFVDSSNHALINNQ